MDLPFSLEIKGGKVFLCLDSIRATNWLKVNRLEMVLPGLKFPFDLGSGLGKFRNRLCRLSLLDITIDANLFLEDLAVEKKLNEKGICALALEGSLVFYGASAVESMGVPFSVRFSASSLDRKIIFAADETFVYGKGLLPGAVIVSGLLAGLGIRLDMDRTAYPVALLGPDAVVGDILEGVLWELLIPCGWKLPDRRGMDIANLEWEDTCLRIRFEKMEMGDSAVDVEKSSWIIHADGEGAILDGRLQDAFQYYSENLEKKPHDEFVLRRVLDLGRSFPSERSRIEELAKKCSDKSRMAALMTLASISLAGGDVVHATAVFSEVVALLEEQGREKEAMVGNFGCATLLEKTDPEQAVDLYLRVLRSDPGNPEALDKLSSLYKELSMWRDYTVLLRKKTSVGTIEDRTAAHVELGWCHLERFHDLLRARAEFEKAIRMNERMASAWMGLAEVHLANGDAQKALGGLAKVEELMVGRKDISPVSVGVKKSVLFKMSGRNEDAEIAIRKALEIDPEDDTAQKTAVEIFESLEKWDLLADLLRRRAGKESLDREDRLRVMTHLAKVEVFGRKDPGAGKVVLDEVFDLEPDFVEGLRCAVQIAKQAGDTEEQIRYLSRIILLEKDDEKKFGLMVRRAELKIALQTDIELTIADLETVAAAKGDFTLRALDLLAGIYREKGMKDCLINSFELWMEENKGGEIDKKKLLECSLELGELLWERGSESDLRKARRCFVGAVDLDSGNPEPLKKMALFLEAANDKQQLERVLQRLVSLLRRKEGWNDLGRAIAWLGKVRLEMGRVEQAAEALREACRLESEDPEILQMLAVSEKRSGNFEQARDAYLRLWELGIGQDEERAQAAFNLGKIYRAGNDFEKAADFFRAALDCGLPDKEEVRECRQGICDAFVRSERWEDAAKAYRNMAEDPELSPEERASALYTGVELLHKRLDKKEEAIALSCKVLEYRPDHVGALNTLETLYGRGEMYEKQAGIIRKKINLPFLHNAEKVALLGRLARLQWEELGQVQAARETCRETLALDKDYLEALLFLARYYYNREDWKNCWSSYGRVLQSIAEHGLDDPIRKQRLQVEGRSNLVRSAIELGLDEELDENAEWILKNDPGNKKVLEQLDRYYEESRDQEALCSILRRRAETVVGEEGIRIKIRLANILKDKLKENRKAAEVYRDILREDPVCSEALFGLAEILKRENRSKERLKVLERLVYFLDGERGREQSLKTDRKQLWKELGVLYFEFQENIKGRKWILRCLSENPEDLEAAEILVQAERKGGDVEKIKEALVAWSRAATDPGLQREILLERAKFYLNELNDPEQALLILDEVAIGEAHEDEIILKGEALERKGDWAGAFSCYEDLVERTLDTNVESAVREKLFNLAQGRLNDDEAAEHHGLKLLEQNPDDFELADRLARIYERQNDEEMRRRMLERCLKNLEKEEEEFHRKRDVIIKLAGSWMKEDRGGLLKAKKICLDFLEDSPEDLVILELLHDIENEDQSYLSATHTVERIVSILTKEMLSEKARSSLLDWYLKLAGLYEKIEQWESSEETLEKALAVSEETERVFILERLLELTVKKENWRKTATLVKELLLFRKTPRDLWLSVTAYEKTGRLDEAIEGLKILQKEGCEEERIKEKLKELYFHSGRHQELAKEFLREADEAESDEDGFCLFLKAAEHFSSAKGGGEDAFNCLIKAWERIPGDPRVADQMETILSKPEDLDKLVAAFCSGANDEKAGKRERSFLLFRAAKRLVGSVFEGENSDHVEKGEGLLSDALTIDPSNEEVRSLLCEIYRKKKDWVSLTAGLQEWMENTQVPQRQMDLGIELASILCETDERAALSVLKGLSVGEKNREFHELMARCCEVVGFLEDAERSLGNLALFEKPAWPVYLRAADLAARRGDVEKEREWLRKGIEEGGPASELACRLAEIERKRGNIRELVQTLEFWARSVDNPEKKAEILLEAARTLKETDPEKSLRLHEDILALMPDEMLFRRHFADLALEMGELELGIEALSLLHENMEVDQRDARGEISVAMAAAVDGIGGDKEAARDIYLRAAEEFECRESRVEALRKTVSLSRETDVPGLEEEASRALIEELGEGQEVIDLKRRLVELVAEREAWKEVLSLSEELRSLGKGTAETFKREATALEILGSWERAAQVWFECADAAEIGFEEKSEYLLRAASLQRDRLEDPVGALDLLKLAMEANPTDPDIPDKIEALCRRYEMWEDLLVVKELSMRGADNPTKTKILHDMAVLRDRCLHDTDGAATLLARAHGINPQFYPALKPLGEYHFRLQEWAPAKDYFLQALEDPDLKVSGRVEILDRLSQIEKAEGRVEEELRYLSEAVSMEPHRDDLWKRIQEVHEKKGDEESLLDVLKNRADLSKGGEKVKHLMAAAVVADRKLGRTEEALRLYEAVVELSPELVSARGRILNLLREKGDWKRLMERLKAELIVAQGLRKAQVAEELASLHEENGDGKTGEYYWRIAYREDPGNAKTIRSLADNLAKRRKWQDLADFLEISLDTVALPDAALSGFMALLGRTYFEKLKDIDKAMEVFERAAMRNALTARSANLLARIYRIQEKYQDLAELLEKEKETVRSESKRREILEELGGLYVDKLKKPAAGAGVYRLLFDADPSKDFEKGVLSVNLLVDSSKYEEAEALAMHVAMKAPREKEAEARLVWGLILLDYLGREDHALEVLSEAVEKRPDLSDGHLALGRILFARGDLDRALFHLEIAAEGEIEAKPWKAEAHQLAGSAAEELNRQADAKRHFEAALELDPTNEDVLHALDRLYTSMGLWKELSIVLGKEIVLEANPDNKAKLWYRRALLSRDILDDGKEALRCLKEAVAVSPEFVEAVSALRQASVEGEDWALAVQLINREIASEKDSFRLSVLYMKLGDLYENRLQESSKAGQAYEEALRRDEANPDPAEALIRVFSQQGRWLDAALMVEELVKRRVGIDKGPLFFKAAKLYKRAGKTDRARQVYLRILKETETSYWPDAVEGLLGVCSRSEDNMDALAVFSDCLNSAQEGNVRIALLRGMTKIYIGMDMEEKAEKLVEEILAHDPADRTAFLFQRKVLEKRGDFQQLKRLLENRLDVVDRDEKLDMLFALAGLLKNEIHDVESAAVYYDRILELDEENWAALDERADLAYRAGDFAAARRYYDRLKNNASLPAKERLYYRKGEIAELFGEEEDALISYEEAVRINPLYRDAWEALARIFLFLGKKEKAADALLRFWDLIPVEEFDTIRRTGDVLVDLLLSCDRLDEGEEVLERLRSVKMKDSPQLWSLMFRLNKKKGNWQSAVDALDHLVLLSKDSREKAGYLFLTGEMLSSCIGDEERAVECFLKGADLDPNHLPTARKLAEYYSRVGEWGQLRDVCEMLVQKETDKKERINAALRLAVSLILEGGEDAVRAPELLKNADSPDPRDMIAILGDAGIGLRRLEYTMASMGRVLDALNSAFGDDAMKKYAFEARELLHQYPGDIGCRRLMPRLDVREARRKTALEHAKILGFLDPEDPSIGDFKDWAGPGKVKNNVLDVDGLLCPDALRVPLRKVLVHLGDVIGGFWRDGYLGDRGEKIENVLTHENVVRINDLVKKMRVPSVEIRVCSRKEFSVQLVDDRIPLILISRPFLERPIEEILFVVSRKLEWVRSGSVLLYEREERELEEILHGLAQEMGFPKGAEKRTISPDLPVAWRERIPRDHVWRREIIGPLMKDVVQNVAYVQKYLTAQVKMAQRVGLMVCGGLETALAAAALEATGTEEILEPSRVMDRAGLLAENHEMKELTRFGVSEKRRRMLGASTRTGY